MGWTFDYVEEKRGEEWSWHDKALLRPVVLIQIAGADSPSDTFVALVDSGCDHILAPEWLARLVGAELDPRRECSIRIAGAPRRVRFADVSLRLCSPAARFGDPAPEIVAEWQTQVGFFLDWSDPPWTVILGQCGFFDEFTVVMSRLSQRLTIESATFHDECYPPGSMAQEPDPQQPRFRP